MNLRILGDPVLNTPSKAVESFDSALDASLRALKQACVRFYGIGIAGPQIGIQRSILVYEPKNFLAPTEALINPEILETSGSCIMEEGCLSIPGFFFPVERAEEIHVRYRLPDGEYTDRDLRGRDARVVLHEMDHLEGTLFIDLISEDDRRLAMKAFGLDPERN